MSDIEQLYKSCSKLFYREMKQHQKKPPITKHEIKKLLKKVIRKTLSGTDKLNFEKVLFQIGVIILQIRADDGDTVNLQFDITSRDNKSS